jgi:purine catabolism regulator
MPTPTVASLCRTLGTDLEPAPGFTAASRAISAVHISELLDPTGYLSGGELLLTTGLTLPRNKIGCERYVGRLVHACVSALALGLGPVHAEIPKALIAACDKLGLPLLTVPAPTPFLRITKAYWAALSLSTERQLKDVLATQRAPVDAAASPDPVSSVLRTLSRSLDAWAATFLPAGELDQVQPPGRADEAERIQDEIARLEGAGVHSAASFSAGTSTVIVFPLVVDDQVAGFLAVGASAPLDQDRRRAVLTASALLSLDTVRSARMQSVRDEAERCVGLLVDLGQVEASRRLAGAVTAPAPPDLIRLLVVEGNNSEPIASVVHRWCRDAIAVRQDHGAAWFILPGAHPSISRLDRQLATCDPAARAVLSEVIPVEQTAAVRAVLTRSVSSLPSGTRALAAPIGAYDGQRARRLATALDRLGARQLESLVGYLRHHGQREAAARSLGVHRNTLRHRIAKCEELLEADLDDPDTSAELWLLLRRRALA